MNNIVEDIELSDLVKKVESLPALAFILRNKELWPKGFEWDYNNCNKCAMGLAKNLWDWKMEEVPYLRGRAVFLIDYFERAEKIKANYHAATQEHLKISGPPLDEIFFNLGFHFPTVTPEMVADKIDAYLKSQCEARKEA